MGQGRARLYNIISSIFLVLTLIAVFFFAARLAAPPPAPTQVAVALPTVAVLPSPTDTYTPTFTLTPTLTETVTPSITPSITPSLTWTLIPSLTASLTYTPIPTSTTIPSATIGPTATIGPSNTTAPTNTITPSLTITSTLVVTPTTPAPTINAFTPQPTEPPPSPFPFVLRDGQVIYTGNFANTAGCAWQGIGGQVFDLSGQPLTQVRIHVFGQGVDLYTASGSNTLYGLSGWEVPLNTTLTSNSYIVELQTSQGTIISPQVGVTFTPDCTKNLALINFAQTRPF